MFYLVQKISCDYRDLLKIVLSEKNWHDVNYKFYIKYINKSNHN